MNSFKCCSTIIYFYSFCALVKIHMASLLALVQCLQYFSSKYLKPLTFSGKKKKERERVKKMFLITTAKDPALRYSKLLPNWSRNPASYSSRAGANEANTLTTHSNVAGVL